MNRNARMSPGTLLITWTQAVFNFSKEPKGRQTASDWEAGTRGTIVTSQTTWGGSTGGPTHLEDLSPAWIMEKRIQQKAEKQKSLINATTSNPHSAGRPRPLAPPPIRVQEGLNIPEALWCQTYIHGESCVILMCQNMRATFHICRRKSIFGAFTDIRVFRSPWQRYLESIGLVSIGLEIIHGCRLMGAVGSFWWVFFCVG